MHIAIVINTSWNIYNFRMGLIKAFLEAGHTVTAIAPFDDYAELLQRAGCQYEAVKLDNKGANLCRDLNFTQEIYGVYRRIRPDVALHYTIKPNVYGTLAATLLGIPVVNNVSGLGTVFLRDNLASRVAHLLYRFTFRFPKKVFFQNQDDQHLFLKRRLVRKSITAVLPGSGVNLTVFQPQPFKRNHPFTFLVIARLIYDKGIVEYADAIRELRSQGIQANFQLLGFKDPSPLGIPEELLQSWIDEGLIDYLGTTDDVRPYIHQADCVVLTSYREGTPRTLLEAISMGKPVLTTDVPGCRETVEDGESGLLCQVRDSVDLAEKLKQMVLLKDHDLERMGRKGREIAEKKFNEDIVVQQYLAVLREIEKSDTKVALCS
ncbi:MAG: glycosyltransferase family 4 protein [Ferruginibacter sp.]|nr:glycosyltransferase family 4 protein [Cytophagales bacterium]